MPDMGTTALVITIPGAEPLMAAARQARPELVRPGLPAHVTVLYPFLSLSEIDNLDALGSALPPVELADIVVTGGMAAIPTPSLQSFVAGVRARWPGISPYGGRFGDNPPAHLTVAMGPEPAELSVVAKAVRPLLPVRTHADAMHLAEMTASGWRVQLSVPLHYR